MKKIIIPILVLMALIGIVSAATVVNLDPQSTLQNASFVYTNYSDTTTATNSVSYNINVTGNKSTYDCDLWTTENGTSGADNWRNSVTNFQVNNNTNTNFVVATSVADAAGATAYTWNVFCNAVGDTEGAWGTSGNYTFGVDATGPSIVITNPSANNVWYTLGSDVRIGLTVTDTNAAQCLLGTNLDVATTSNSTTTYNSALGIKTYTTATQFNFSAINATNNWDDNNGGDYLYTYICNDSAGNIVSLGSNYTFYVDSTAPGAFDFNISLWATDNRALSNATYATDYTPTIGWGLTTELNFSHYEITYFKDAYGVYNSSTDVRDTVTTITTLSDSISTLEADADYLILVTAYDLAGNANNITTLDYKYSTDSTNRALSAGWNIVGNVGNAFNLSDLRTWTGATTVSIWNATHEFQSHVSGGSNGAASVTAGNPVFIYVATDTILSDLIWNTTVVDAEAVSVLNYSSSGSNDAWNIVMMRDDTDDKNMQELDSYVNCLTVGAGCAAQVNNASNIDVLSFYNNSGVSSLKYVSMAANWSINNATPLTFGDSVWLYANENLTINWSAI